MLLKNINFSTYARELDNIRDENDKIIKLNLLKKLFVELQKSVNKQKGKVLSVSTPNYSQKY